MNNIIKGLFFSITALLLVACEISNNESREINMTKTQFIPRKILFGNPDKVNVKLSSDGKYISYVAPYNEVLNIFVAKADDLESAKPVTSDKGKGISNYAWTYLPNLMVYSQDTDGDENSILYTLDLNTLEAKAVTPKGVKSYVQNVSSKYAETILVAMNERSQVYHDIYKLNLKTGNKALVYQNDEYASFTSDDDNNIRFATKSLANGNQQIDEFKDNQKVDVFKTILFEDTDTSGLVGLNKAATKLFLLDSSDRDKAALYGIELETNVSKVIAQSDKADISSVIFDPKTYEVQGYEYEYERSVTKVIDPKIADDIKYLQSVSDGDLNITSRTTNDDFWIVAYNKSDASTPYYKYDRANKKATFLFVQRSALEKFELSPMHSVIIKARDDLELVSYLTLPKGINLKPAQPLPLILYVHGGPNHRDSWGYNPVHQWLADRGFAVLSVNYRGSTGVGKSFIRAGDGEWSTKMHDDLIDAAQWAINQGITTKDKIGIFGGSYGGYATLVGLTMTPDFFVCGVDIVGPSNLKTLYDSIPPYWEPYKASLKRKFGSDPETKEGLELLDKRSPIHYVDNIKKPLLIAQGANDPRVKQAESDQIVDLMVKKGIPVTYLLYPNEGHGFARPENKAAFYAKAEEFLGNCFGVVTEPVGSDLESSSMKVIQEAKKTAK